MKVLVVLALLLTSTACSVGSTEPLVVDVDPPAQQPPPTIRAGVCIDTTRSMPAETWRPAVGALADTVEHWVSATGDMTAGALPVPALELAVRKVLPESSLDVAGEVRRTSLPGVPGVMRKPEVTDEGYVDRLRAWREQVRRAEDATARATAKAKQEAQAIRAADWRSGSSEIAGCLEALALTTHGDRRRFVLLSDLEQTDPAQAGLARLDGAAVLIVHACNRVQRCLDQQRRWERTLNDRGAAEVKYARPEEISEAMSSWLRPDRS